MENEKELVLRAKKDPEAFGEIYDHFSGLIFNFVFRRTVDFDLSNDITSEVFLKAYSHLWKFQWRNISLTAWLYRIANNEVNMYFRNKKYMPDSLDELRQSTGYDIPHEHNYLKEKIQAETEIQRYQEFLQIQAIVLTFGIKYQEVIALRFFEQKTIKEICEILDKKEGTVKSLLSRGLDMIRQALNENSVGQPISSIVP